VPEEGRKQLHKYQIRGYLRTFSQKSYKTSRQRVGKIREKHRRYCKAKSAFVADRERKSRKTEQFATFAHDFHKKVTKK
jgi:hypothetical protein